MTIPSSRHFPSSTDRAPVTSRETTLDDTIEDSFPASDPPSSIPDPEPASPMPMSAEAIEESLTDHPIFWAALGAVVISALWLGLSWQRGRLS